MHLSPSLPKPRRSDFIISHWKRKEGEDRDRKEKKASEYQPSRSSARTTRLGKFMHAHNVVG